MLATVCFSLTACWAVGLRDVVGCMGSPSVFLTVWRVKAKADTPDIQTEGTGQSSGGKKEQLTVWSVYSH